MALPYHLCAKKKKQISIAFNSIIAPADVSFIPRNLKTIFVQHHYASHLNVLAKFHPSKSKINVVKIHLSVQIIIFFRT